jgi:hypothetical protein
MNHSGRKLSSSRSGPRFKIKGWTGSECLLAMKYFAMRLGEEIQDRNDVAVPLNVLGLRRSDPGQV